jgi:hypothetical protein
MHAQLEYRDRVSSEAQYRTVCEFVTLLPP